MVAAPMRLETLAVRAYLVTQKKIGNHLVGVSGWPACGWFWPLYP
jgi:hypothetical protein